MKPAVVADTGLFRGGNSESGPRLIRADQRPGNAGRHTDHHSATNGHTNSNNYANTDGNNYTQLNTNLQSSPSLQYYRSGGPSSQ